MMNTQNDFPRQKMSSKQKNKPWRRSNVDWADSHSQVHDNSARKSLYNKKINLDLFTGTIHLADVKKHISSVTVDNLNMSKGLQYYPIANDVIDVLLGEDLNRKFEYNIRVTNPDAISDKEKELKALALQDIFKILETEGLSDEQLEKRLKEKEQYFKYTWQEGRERSMQFLLDHFRKELNVKETLNQALLDLILQGEEAAIIDIVSGEPTVNKLDTSKVRVISNGKSRQYEDADAIVIEDYWSKSRIQDTFYDVLKDKEVTWLDQVTLTGQSSDNMKNEDETAFWRRTDGALLMDGLQDDFGIGNGYIDDDGNIRVLRLFWKSKRKVLKVKKIDVITGTIYHEYHDESYVPLKDFGEEAKPEWINEAWEGTKVGENIYLNMRPREIQYNRMSNPSRCHFGIVGNIDSINKKKPYSMLDKMKPSIYLFCIIYQKLIDTIARDPGKIQRVDVARIPDGMDMEKWMFFRMNKGISFEDSFKEGNIGAAKGKLAGGMTGAGGQEDLSLYDQAQGYYNLCMEIKATLDSFVGITPQRKGAISSRETVGGVERAVLQSSHITQRLMATHQDFEQRVYSVLLETIKIAYKESGNLKYQFITDDYSTSYIDIQGSELAEADYGLIVDNDSNNFELSQTLHQLALSWANNNIISPKTLINIYREKSLSQIMRDMEFDIQKTEDARQQELQQQQQQHQEQLQAASQQAEAMLAQEQANKEADIQKEIYIAELDSSTKLSIEQLKQEGNVDQSVDNSGKEFNHKVKFDNDKLNIARKQLQEVIRSNKAKESISKNKPTTKK